jgi:23S rRNA G2445 N2-methylase RlmL
LKKNCAGSTAFIYFGDRAMLKHIGLKPAWKRALKNGGLDGRLAKFDMYPASDRPPRGRGSSEPGGDISR